MLREAPNIPAPGRPMRYVSEASTDWRGHEFELESRVYATTSSHASDLLGKLDAGCKYCPGAVGILSPETGAFQFVSTLPDASIRDTSAAQNDWSIKSSSVHESQTSVALDGSYTDPETNTKVTAGLKSTWSFAEAGSISSNFTLAKQSTLVDFGHQIQKQRPWLVDTANSVGMAPKEVIAQGFGVVTAVIYAACGLNIGAQNASSTFSIEGSVGATNAMAGKGEANAKGSYARKKEDAAFESHLWPSKAGALAEGPIPIAFEFASFVGGQLIPSWVTNVSAISIILADDHGGTYIVDANAAYEIGGAKKGVYTRVTGGLTAVMDAIPPEATNLELQLKFGGLFSDTYHRFSWPSPLVTFPKGQIVIDLYGVWPGATSATERLTGATG